MINSKAKTLFFLLFLVGFSLLAVTLLKKENIQKEVVIQSSSPQIEPCCGNTTQENVQQNEDNFKVVMLKESESIDITKNFNSVLGASACDQYNPTDILNSVKKVCPTTGYTLNHKESQGSRVVGSSGGGVNVEQITSFKLVQVTYPLAFWLGKFTMATSNKEITKVDAAYASNGEQIDEDYQLKTLAPAQAVETKEKIKGTEREPFSVKGNLFVNADKVDENTEGEYVVRNAENEPKCNCPEEVSNSDYNVGKSNKLGSVAGGYDRQQIPGGDNYEVNDANECLNSGTDFNTISVGTYSACVDLIGIFKGFFNKVFSTNEWSECNEGRVVCEYDSTTGGNNCRTVYSDCVDPRNMAVKMTPIFGEPYECTDDLCANAFLTYSYRGTLSPDQAANKKTASSNAEESIMYFVGTQCVAEIQVQGGGTKTMPVTCLWDASPTLLNYKLQAKDKAPNQEDFPQTFQEYWNGVEKAVNSSATAYGL